MMLSSMAVVYDRLIPATLLCHVQVTVLEAEFLKNDGDPQWLKGLQYVPTKVVNLLTINKMLAHQPWFVKPTHMKVSHPQWECAWGGYISYFYQLLQLLLATFTTLTSYFYNFYCFY